MHDADEDGVGANGRFERVHAEHAIFLHVEVSHLKALTLQLAHGVKHGFVLGLHRDEVLAFGLVELRRAFDGEVVGFCRA